MSEEHRNLKMMKLLYRLNTHQLERTKNEESYLQALQRQLVLLVDHLVLVYILVNFHH